MAQPLPVRARRDGHVAVDGDVEADALQLTLREILTGHEGLTGVLVATLDGLLVAGEFDVAAPAATRAGAETLSAMAATTAGMAMMFADRLALSRTAQAGCVVHGDDGCVAVQRVSETDVLVLFGGDGLTLGRLHLAMRRALPRVRTALVAPGD